jgi:hypothetical protein
MFRRRPRPRSRLNLSIYLTVILTVLTSVCALSPVGVTTGNAGRIVSPASFAVAPTNDNFANAQPILGASGVIVGNNVGATKEPLELKHAGHTGGASVWYRWQAPFDGTFVFTTNHNQTVFRTVLAVYRGDSLPGTPVAANDVEPLGCTGFSSEPLSSRVAFPAVGGVVYHIAVDIRFSDAPGNFRLRWGRSARITGRISDASGIPTVIAETVLLQGDICRRSESFSTVFFSEVPTGGEYNVFVSGSGKLFTRWGTTESLSPLGGDVSNYNYYQTTPAYTISGSITVPGGDLGGVMVTCAATGAALFSTTGFISSGKYSCASLPTNANYVVTATKPGVRFSPPNWTINNLRDHFAGASFTGETAPTYTIVGQIKTATGAAVNGASVVLSGLQTASTSTDANGNYSLTGILEGGNYTVTPANANLAFSPASLSFGNVTANQTANFTAAFLLGLVLDDAGQAVALDSMLHVRDPFAVINQSNQLNRGVDRNTRVAMFVTNFVLGPGETASSVVINLIGSNNQSYDIPAEDVRPLADTPYTQIIFRLPDTLTAGTSTLVVKGHGLTSNIGSLKIK